MCFYLWPWMKQVVQINTLGEEQLIARILADKAVTNNASHQVNWLVHNGNERVLECVFQQKWFCTKEREEVRKSGHLTICSALKNGNINTVRILLENIEGIDLN